MVQLRLLLGRPQSFHAVDRWRQLGQLAANIVQESLLRRREEPARRLVGGRGHDSGTDDNVRLLEIGRGLKYRAIKLQRSINIGGSKMRCEREGQAQGGSQPCAEIAG